MLARLAENLLWAGRYLERAEDTARLLDVTYHGLLETPAADPALPWHSLLASLSQLGAFEATGATFTDAAVTRFLVTDRDNPGSVAASVAQVRENIRSLREQVSTELWEAINSFHLELESRNLAADLLQQRFELYGTIKQRCQTIAGVADQTMPRNDGWRFFFVGRQLERAIMMARLLEAQFRDFTDDAGVEFHQWRNLLRAASAFEAYSRSGRATMRPDEAFDYLLLDPEFPRSILFCLRSSDAQLARILSPDPTQPSLRVLGRARAMLEYSEPSERRGARREQMLSALIAACEQTFDAITTEYFVPARPGQVQFYGVA